MALTKKFLKSKPICKVTFKLPKEAVENAKKVCIVGDFNQWDKETNALKRNKNGSYTITLDLEVGSDYQFRYLLDDTTWINDWDADRYEFNPVGNCENSVVALS